MLPPIKKAGQRRPLLQLIYCAQGFVQINDTFVIFNTAFYETLILCTHYPFVVSGIVIAQDKVFYLFLHFCRQIPAQSHRIRTGSDQKRK